MTHTRLYNSDPTLNYSVRTLCGYKANGNHEEFTVKLKRTIKFNWYDYKMGNDMSISFVSILLKTNKHS